MKIWRTLFCISSILFFLTGCQETQTIATGIDEREANLILVFLDSRGIKAIKAPTASTGMPTGGTLAPTFDIVVGSEQAIDAMAYLNKNGLPRKQGTNLLDLFAKQGLTTTAKEEDIRYQAGLAQQIANTILRIDGVIDASVQLSFPPEEVTPGVAQQGKITAAVYVKHQGIVDDPNSHLENKIKRLVSGSVSGLDINDVTVISDRARLSEILPENMALAREGQHEYVKIWSIILSKDSAGAFRSIFFFLLFAALLFAVALGWLLWKLYPMLRQRGGLKKLITPAPLETLEKKE